MPEWNGASWVSRSYGQACTGLLPWDRQERIRLRASLARAWLVAVRSGSHAVTDDRTQNHRDCALSGSRGHLRQQAVKGRQRLARPLQAHLAWHHPMPQGRLGPRRPEQGGDQQMAPDLLPHHRWRLAPQPIQLHDLCDRAELQGRMPPCPGEPGQLLLGGDLGLQQGGRHEDHAGAAAALWHTPPQDPYVHGGWQSSLGGLVHPRGPLGLGPGKERILATHAPATPQGHLPPLMEPHHASDAPAPQQGDFPIGAIVTNGVSR